MAVPHESNPLPGARTVSGTSGSAHAWTSPTQDSGARCAAERRLQAFSATSDEVVWELDRDGLITYVSAAVTRHLGYQPIELLGQRWQAIMPTSEHGRGSALIESSAKAGARWDDEQYVFTTKAGHRRPLWSTGLALVDEHGLVVGFAGTLRPVHQDGVARDERVRQVIEDIIGWRLIQPVFQPITDLAHDRTIAVEALSRFPFHHTRSPAQMFAHAAALGLTTELEFAAIDCALTEAQALPDNIAVSINVSPYTLASDQLWPRIADSAVHPRRIILEITEQIPITEYAPIITAVDRLRARGCRLAVDDAGAGYASLKHILALSPDLIKLDRFLVTDITTDPARRALIRSVVSFAGEVGAEIVAEGIESADQVTTLQDLGLRYGQGYFLAPPSPVSESAEVAAPTRRDQPPRHSCAEPPD
jgi:PAS domain S-box-containing protein